MSLNDSDLPSERATRAGYVALVGRPNAGKSTLMNTLVGERLSIVSPKAQTTWTRVTGIRTEGDSQMVFLDTPGVLEAKDLIHHALNAAAELALRDADVVCLIVDASRRMTREDEEQLQAFLKGVRVPILLALNKSDRLSRDEVQAAREKSEELFGVLAIPLSAETGEGIPELIEAMEAALPLSPFLYPEDELATEPVRFFAAELVRETVFEQFQDEIPYSVFARVEEFREGGERTYIQVTLYVERASQKGILIGEGGKAIRTLGTAARGKLEHFLQEPVYLDLWVKVLPRWRKKRGELRRFGLPVPEEKGGGAGK